MVTVPAAEETPELTPNCPEVAEKSTVTPATASLLAFRTVTVMVVDVEPSALIEALELLRLMEAADWAGDAGGTPPPGSQPIIPLKATSSPSASDVRSLRFSIPVPIQCAPADRLAFPSLLRALKEKPA